ncbi:carbohydrate kinase family protein [Thermoflexibacter ruber]|uniref:Fructokinase n=1 Tax=Thermoflexibacter ruber TaxID=1003 RepID=A0A1I2JA42_9BACT|nr:carbohydrate kinase [Thermoflexibacter ruber]SFF51384.1 fructokinase [Thermoflexibacter ruber]
MKILCIGEALIDMICIDKGKPLSEGENFLKKTGGAPTNVAAAVAALGGQVALAAKVGNDPFGKQLIDTMQNFGVDTRLMFQDKNVFTTLAFVSLMENGERDFVFSRGADANLSIEEIERVDLNEFGIVHFGSATCFLEGDLREAYQYLLNKALTNNLFISFDPNYRHLLFKDKIQDFIDQSWYFLEHCHFFKLSDEEAMLLTKKNSLQEAARHFLEKTKAIFAITLGKEGTLLGYQDQLYTIPSIPINPVDTTGAGDAFVGAVLYQLSRYSRMQTQSLSFAEWQSIITNANRAGAHTCEYMGAMEAFKHLSSGIFLQ